VIVKPVELKHLNCFMRKSYSITIYIHRVSVFLLPFVKLLTREMSDLSAECRFCSVSHLVNTQCTQVKSPIEVISVDQILANEFIN